MIRLAVRCDPAQAEIVLAELTVIAPGGVEESSGPGYVEYAIYGAEGEVPDIGDIEAAAGDGLVEVRSTEVSDDWAERWREFHRPVLVGGRLWLRPPWEPARDDLIDVVVDPGQAFGTGAHPTTRLCLELMLEAAGRGEAAGELLDLGTGSGVLAIAAAKLGWDPVRGCDHERAALAAAEENAAANGVAVETSRCNLREELPEPAPVIIANLTGPMLIAVAGLIESVEPPETLICSGLLGGELDEVAASFATRGLGERERRRMGDWAALRLARGPGRSGP